MSSERSQIWLQYIATENGNPIYSENLIDVPENWDYIGDYQGKPIYAPAKTLLPENAVNNTYPSAPLASVAPYSLPFSPFPAEPTVLSNSSIYPAVEFISKPTHDRLTEKGQKVSQMTIAEFTDNDKTFKLVTGKLMKYLKGKAEEASKKGKIFVYTISGMTPEIQKKLKSFLTNIQKDMPANLEIHLISGNNQPLKFEKKPLEQPPKNKKSQYNCNAFLLFKDAQKTVAHVEVTISSPEEPTSSRVVKIGDMTQRAFANHNDALNIVIDACIDRLENVISKIIKDPKNTVVTLYGNFLPGVKERFAEKLADERKKGRLSDVTIHFKDVKTEKVTQKELFNGLKDRLKDKEIVVPLTLTEQIDALSFSPNNKTFENQAVMLGAWKNALKKLLKEAGNDVDAKKQVQTQLEKTQDVIRAVEKYVESVKSSSTDQADNYTKLTDALTAFEENVLALSGKEWALIIGIAFMLIMAMTPISLAMLSIPILGLAVAALLAMTFFVTPYLVALGTSVAAHAMGMDAASPPPSKNASNPDFISPKLTELGFFGNTPRHKARSFIEEVKKASGENQSQEVGRAEEETDKAIVAPTIY